MLGTFVPDEIRVARPGDVPPLTLVEWGGFKILTIVQRDDTPGAIALVGEHTLTLRPLPNQHGATISCAGLLLVEILSETVEIRDVPRDPFGWLAFCSSGVAAVCSARDGLGFSTSTLISLTDGRELAENAIYREAAGAVQHWRLLRKSAGDGAPLVLIDCAAPVANGP